MKRQPKMVVIPMAQFKYLKAWAIEGLNMEYGMSVCSPHENRDRYDYSQSVLQKIKSLKNFKPETF